MLLLYTIYFLIMKILNNFILFYFNNYFINLYFKLKKDILKN